MGKLVWSQWANLIAITAGVFQIVGGIFGLFYRIAMFGGVTTIFNEFVNPINYLAIFTIVSGFIILFIEYPIQPFKNFLIITLYLPRILLYLIISGISILNYQNVNPAVYLHIATIMYATAMVKGENKHRSTGNRVNQMV